MHIIFQCPVCESRVLCEPENPQAAVKCSSCDWSRDEGQTDYQDEYLRRCRVCGCEDLWRQKDFPPGLGLAMVAMGALLSTIAWYQYEKEWALGILLAFGFVDMVLYIFMKDRLVCYRCASRHRQTPLDQQHAGFNLEVNERYVQTRKRQEEAERQQAARTGVESPPNETMS